MIIFVETCMEENEVTGKMEEIVSHGVNEFLEDIPLPSDTVSYARNAGWLKFSEKYGYYMEKDNE